MYYLQECDYSVSPATQDNYFTVTMEKGEVFLRSNLLDAPATKGGKSFPVRSFFCCFLQSLN